jgi:serine protease Do
MLRIGEPERIPSGTDLEFGDSDRLQVGHWLIALGDPPGPERSFAVGVVATQAQRQCYQAKMSATMVQSSLVVPPASVGGPVVDIFGRVVGMTVRPQSLAAPAGIPAPTQVLPANLLLNINEALKVAQSRRSPWIGISVLELPALRRRLGDQAKTAGFPLTGVYIDDVFDPSPAFAAGVRPGDFLVAMNDHRVVSVADFQTWLYVTGIDARIDLDLLRDGKPLKLSMKIESRPPSAVTN